LLVILYTVPIYYMWTNRKQVSFRTRSPKMIILAFIYMMLNSVLNTIWMTKQQNVSSPLTFQCDLGIVISVCCMLGLMSVYFTRMWRVYKVFSLY
jgi:hypothetical protein